MVYELIHTAAVLDMLRTLLERPAPVEDYIEWMDKIIERKIIKVRISANDAIGSSI